jgi:outer membrane lipoprotein-sorting protein
MHNGYTNAVDGPAKAYIVLSGGAKPEMPATLFCAARVAVLLLVPALLLAQPVPQASDDELAKSIVEKADQVRFPAEPFEVSIAISTTDAGQPAEVRRYRVFAKGHENTIIMVTEPASDRGQILLMKGHDLWIFLPTLSQPVRLSLSQRLTGQVANGDLARANLAGDYAAKVLRIENTGNDARYVLELTANDRSVTYHRVLYWVGQTNYRPYRAEFYSLSDRLLKTCVYENYKPMAGRERPTRLVMQNALAKDEESVLEYSNMRVRDLPDRMFTKDYLKRLE